MPLRGSTADYDGKYDGSWKRLLLIMSQLSQLLGTRDGAGKSFFLILRRRVLVAMCIFLKCLKVFS